MDIVQYYQTNNPCYKAGKKITPSGIVVHSTGANNPNLKRYVGPDDGILGKNQYNNHWNKADATKCMHAFIGKVADGRVMAYQTLPWDHRCWGVGSGKNGSYNASHIQFEICEDGLNNEEYYKEAFNLAKELCAFLCEKFGIDTDNVVGHYEAAAAGYGSSHADPHNWQKLYGDTMDGFRADVKALLGKVDASTTEAEVKPEPEPKPEETQTDSGTIYTVQKGDTLWKISKKYLGAGKRYKEIQSANSLSSDHIMAGQKLKIPKG